MKQFSKPYFKGYLNAGTDWVIGEIGKIIIKKKKFIFMKKCCIYVALKHSQQQTFKWPANL